MPGIILAPQVLSGDIEVGRVVQAAGAFAAIFTAWTVIVNNFDTLSRFAAAVYDYWIVAWTAVVPKG